MHDETSLTPQEVADRLRIAKNTVYELIKRGELESYRIGRKIRIDARAVEALKGKYGEPSPASAHPAPDPHHPGKAPSTAPSASEGFIICGQDGLLDILAQQLEKHPLGARAFRSHMGSYNGLFALYKGEVHVATTHLWDGDSGEYNVPYIRKMLPGLSPTLIHLAKRMQGFYVKRGNPRAIKDWKDLQRPDVIMVNREKGSGTRVLLDEHFRLLNINPDLVQGYYYEVLSHLEAAIAVSGDDADVAVGNEKTASLVEEIEFIPMQQEDYEMAMLKQYVDHPPYSIILEILNSSGFRNKIEALGGYDVSNMGRIIL